MSVATSNQALNLDALKWRLAETISWCMRLGSMPYSAHAATELRTPELCPTGFIYSTNKHGYTDLESSLGDQESSALTGIVEKVAGLRVNRLKQSKIYPLAPAKDLAGGKLLCYAPYENLAEGVEEQETQGYFDVRAVPPWDTWLWFTTRQTRLKKRPYGQEFWYDTYLISWVPPELVDIVDMGPRTSTTYALAWADDLDSELLAMLRSASIHI